ncbi:MULTISPECIES: acetyl-CoA hydrolase/transferase family protein [Pseudomonas]|uniref:acetyl-CoA hydrolase/transferase family protein n=1 Tax=Pseudomonas TaxID=286 RepID=UPI000F755BEE|nr:acetyl-CoA hydrolase/transferase C-terminal domain-containing protein [Pseudomonas aeruginosa]AZN49990.1 acetyl-CoA hydrolase [Pseudomonas aeruginosa]EKW5415297.1 hypothetical protein [Pseudomonas aeruginosa]MBN0213577.1 hypothetical protein [Pseudomonas aeruginosa]MBN0610475.1 hypothetical protein [Pseudomonas aeruginosa]MBN0805144.1 hypothetical protein [Pseudomonas aeruginosa]
MTLRQFDSAAAVVALLRPGMNVFVPGVSGESLAFYRALQAEPGAAAGVRFIGAHFPGINTSDYLGLHGEARQRGYFMQPGLRAGLADGRAQLLPLDYPAIWRDLLTLDIDLAIAQVSPPDAEGRCSLGPSQDFLPAIWARARQRIAHINSQVPPTAGSFHIDYAELHGAFHCDEPLLEFVPGGDTPSAALVEAVVSLVRDSDTLECGIGTLPNAILGALHGHRNLRVWSGMATAAMAGLIDAGAISGHAAVNAGVALGDAAFYRRIGDDPTFFFRPVAQTHDVRRIAALPGFCAINSAVEVDLFGQVNADTLRGRQVAGVGGLPAFVSGASLSEGGRSIIALNAATQDGRFSRIVGQLDGQTLVALPRHGADYVVTEYGIAALRGLDLHSRAKALIAIAAPAFRDELARGWQERLGRL